MKINKELTELLNPAFVKSGVIPKIDGKKENLGEDIGRVTKKSHENMVKGLYSMFINYTDVYSKGNYGPYGLYPKQKLFVIAFLNSLIAGHNAGDAFDVAYKKTRRSGGSQIVIDLVAFLMLVGPDVFGKEEFFLMILVNVKKQVRNSYHKVKKILEAISRDNIMFNVTLPNGKTVEKRLEIEKYVDKEQILMTNGSLFLVGMLTGKANAGEDLDVLFVDEAQAISKEKGARTLEVDFIPMLIGTGGTTCYVGVANDNLTYFHTILDNPETYVIDFDVLELIDVLEIITKYSDYPRYHSNLAGIKKDLASFKEGTLNYTKHRAFETEFLLKWLLEGEESFISHHLLTAGRIEGRENYTIEEIEENGGELRAGIDYAQAGDKTVVIITQRRENGKFVIVGMFTFKHKDVDYTIQVDKIIQFLLPYADTKLLKQITTDNTGVGRAVNNILEKEWRELVVKGRLWLIKFLHIDFSAQTKNDMGLNMHSLFLSKKIEYCGKHEMTKDFESQFMTLTKTTLNGMFKFKHKTESDRDDIPDALALSLIGFVNKIEKITRDPNGKKQYTKYDGGFYIKPNNLGIQR